MGLINHTVTTTWGGGSSLLGQPDTLTGDNEQNSSLSLGIVTNQLVPLAFASAKLKSIYIVASQDCVLKFNSSGSPTDTINLKANVPFAWNSSSGLPYPFTGTAGAITAVYVTTTVPTEYDHRALTID